MNEKQLNIGLGLRSLHYSHILETRPKISWFEALSENYMNLNNLENRLIDSPPLKVLERIRELYPVAFHGVSLSIGSVDPLNMNYLKNLKELIERIDPLWVSDHICWTGVEGENTHDLLPLPYTEEALIHLTEKIFKVQDYLKRPMVFENVSAYLTYKHSEMKEWEFIAELIKRTDCEVVLDVNNVFVSSVNQKFDPFSYIEHIPKNRIREIHLAGHSKLGEICIDTHDSEVSAPVWKLYQKTIELVG
ncbi:MAG: MNIO family bufferin maturase, partial [Bacteriovorax sp.]